LKVVADLRLLLAAGITRAVDLLRRIPLFWRFQIAGWGFFAVLAFPFKLYVFETVGMALLVTVVREPLGIGLSYLLRLLFRHFFPQGERTVRLGAFIVAFSILLGGIDALVGQVAVRALGFSEHPFFTFGLFCFRSTLFLAWSLLYLGIKAQMAAHERELGVARAETAARDAELQMLRAQIDPHFLFNALNTILSTLDPAHVAPKRIVEGLATYLRYSLQHRHDAFVPLHAEFAATLAYLAVEQERFRGELQSECSLDERARDALVPGVLLQPLVENAIKYSRQTSEPPYRVQLRVTAPADDALTIEVANSGEWVEPASVAAPHGVGLDNLRRRLAFLYPGRHELSISHDDPGWVWVRIAITGAGRGIL
jgi:hypothetical protein